MISNIAQFAEENSANNLLDTLGIDWAMLIFQIVAFLILLFILIKFIYPPILAMLDRHDKAIEDSLKAAEKAQKEADKSQAASAKLLEDARSEADAIIATAKAESADIMAEAEADAKQQAEIILMSAKTDIEREAKVVRQVLRGETLHLVSVATKQIIDHEINDTDETLIKNIIKGAKS